jgi:hypothetical protein
VSTTSWRRTGRAPATLAVVLALVLAMVLALVLALVLAGCTHRERDRARILAEEPARRMVGVWDVSFRLDRPVRPGASPGGAPVVRGVLALIEDRLGVASAGEAERPLLYGVHDVDFTPFAFDLQAAGRIPTATARPAPGGAGAPDSVAILLDGRSGRLAVILSGVVRGDGVSGEWRVESAARGGFGGGGHFSMRRHPVAGKPARFAGAPDGDAGDRLLGRRPRDRRSLGP